MTNAVSSLKLEQRGACLDKVSVKYQTSAYMVVSLHPLLKEQKNMAQFKSKNYHHIILPKVFIHSLDTTSTDIEIFWLRFIIYIMSFNF